MRKYKGILMILSLALLSLVSCDKDVDLPNQITIFDGFYIYGSATPMAELDNENFMPIVKEGEYEVEGQDDKVKYNLYGRFINLKSGAIIVSKESNSTVDQRFSTVYGKDAEGLVVENGENPIEFIEAAGMYFVRMDTYNKELSLTAIASWGVIGDATPGGWGTDTDMTLVAEKSDELTYVYTCDLHLEGGKKFKFRANDGWAVNFGVTDGSVLQDGDNILVGETGEYTVTLTLGRKNSYTITKN